MLTHCPGCGYDLAGLPHSATPVCPECGDTLDPDTLLERYKPGAGTWWLLVLLSPFLALPACLAIGNGQPIVAWCLASYFSYRAMRIDDAAQGHPANVGSTVLNAVVIGFFWTLLTTMVMVLVAMLGVAVFRMP